MNSKIKKRLWQFIPVVLGVTFLAFSLMYMAPGDPIDIRLSAGGVVADPAIIKQMRDEMGLNDPFIIQYLRWLSNFFTGDLGYSYINDQAVLDKILDALPYTLKLAGLSMVLTLVISIPVGILLAAFKNSKIDYSIRGVTFIANSVPSFIIGIVLMYIFAFKLGVIPVLATSKFMGMILPSVTLAIVMCSRYIRQIRAATLDEFSKDYIVGLRARGISEQVILYKNVLKSISGFIITLIALSIGSLMGGTVIVETIFNWPGIGHLVMQAIEHRDFPVVLAVVVWMSITFLMVNLLADIAQTRLNPKIKDI